MKVMPHFEVLKRIERKVDFKLIGYLTDKAAIEGRNVFFIDKAERVAIGVQLKVSERSIANALARLSKPSELGGVEIFVRIGRGRYRLNPYYYFVGRPPELDAARENYIQLRLTRIAIREKGERKMRPKKAPVLELVKEKGFA